MTSTASEHTSWTAAGSDASAQRTYASVKTALEDLDSRRDIEVFLQGSYANTTNIRADSDVDVVVMTTKVMFGSLDRLGPASRSAWDRLGTATYRASDLRSEVQASLTAYYGSSRVEPKNKCIKVHKTSGYLDADVVPCIQYRWYPDPNSDIHYDFVEGVNIRPLRGEPIINFPKVHIENGKRKNKDAGLHYKKTVRQMKHLRNRAVNEGRLADGVAPGYLLECMTFNAPDSDFVSNDSERLKNVVLSLKFADKAGFSSCDGIHGLFVDDPGNFSAQRGQNIADALWDAY